MFYRILYITSSLEFWSFEPEYEFHYIEIFKCLVLFLKNLYIQLFVVTKK